MRRSVVWHFAVAFATVMLCCGTAVAQEPYDQGTACPGWHNPLNFTIGNGTTENGNPKGWQGRLGTRRSDMQAIPNTLTGETGVDWQSSIITANNLASMTMTTGGDCALFPGTNMNARAFTILDSNTQCSGYPVNRDPNTNCQLRYVPTHFNVFDSSAPVQTNITRSIRVGDACGRTSGALNAEALYYTMTVKPQNAMLYLYYAVVTESSSATSGHGPNTDPAFMIRVCKKDAQGQWVQASPTGHYPGSSYQCDTMAYFITATPYGTGYGQSPTGLQDGVNGWHYYASNAGSAYSTEHVWYKDWSKVVINLSSLLYDDVRIEVMVSDCGMVQHFAYAYVAGECRPMKVESSGCAAGMSTDVTTLTAPRGMDNYVWYRSEYGTTEGNQINSFYLPNSDPSSTAYYTFAPLTPLVGTEQDTAYLYKIQAEDFQVTYRRNPQHTPGIPASADSMGNYQVFRCDVTTRIDPTKPFITKIYTVVQNTKPTMEINAEPFCGGDLHLQNRSYVAGSYSMANLDSTIWSFYDNAACVGDPLRRDTGENLTVHFDGDALRYVKVRTNIDEYDPGITTPPAHNECYSEAIYPIQPMPYPEGGFTIAPDTVVYTDAVVTLHDTTANSTYRVWRFRDTAENASMELVDSVVGYGDDNRIYNRIFTHTDEPIELTVRNGFYSINPVDMNDTLWCENTLYGRIHVIDTTHTGGDDTTHSSIPAIDGMAFTVSPNPVYGVAEVTLPEPMEADGVLSLYDLGGREVRQTVVPVGSSRVTFDTEGCPAGAYLLKLVSPQGVATRRLLVANGQ